MADIHTGSPFPLGATVGQDGVNFAIYSGHATAVQLCLFNTEKDTTPSEVIDITSRSGHIWHVFVKGAKPGQLYGYRVDGPFEPANGFRFNKNKLLIDPNAKALTLQPEWNEAIYGYELGNEDGDLSFSKTDSTPFVPKSIVDDLQYDWENDRQPKIPWHKSVIYELHVKGFTQLHPAVPEPLRGTYAGLAHPEVIKYLKDLGVTAIELMPVHYFLTDHALEEKGLSNYWGYNTIGFFAPHTQYASLRNENSQKAVIEFKDMVKAMHKAGIEVILDVVYNYYCPGKK